MREVSAAGVTCRRLRGFDYGAAAGDLMDGFELFESEIGHGRTFNFSKYRGNYIHFYCGWQAVRFWLLHKETRL